MTETIDLNCLLPDGIQFTPLFPEESAYRDFRARYADDMRPKRDKLNEARRRSEEEARLRPLV